MKDRRKKKKDGLREARGALEKDLVLAHEIVELRKRRGLTQEQLARNTGTSPQAIEQLESGTCENISLALLRRVAIALGAIPEIHLRETEHSETGPPFWERYRRLGFSDEEIRDIIVRIVEDR
jgi:transcriptional regulator with XRE-family HTH domain